MLFAHRVYIIHSVRILVAYATCRAYITAYIFPSLQK